MRPASAGRAAHIPVNYPVVLHRILLLLKLLSQTPDQVPLIGLAWVALSLGLLVIFYILSKHVEKLPKRHRNPVARLQFLQVLEQGGFFLLADAQRPARLHGVAERDQQDLAGEVRLRLRAREEGVLLLVLVLK